jgi:hypothetical protein
MRKIGFILLFLPIFALAQTEQSQDEKQLYNMSFDEWSKRRGAWFPQPEDAKGREKDWDSANKGLSFIGLNGTTPEYEHVAVKGEGKAACRIKSRNFLGIFVAGNLYNGAFIKIAGMSGAVLSFGVPFSHRPKSLSGYYHYKPGIVDLARKPREYMRGRTDEAKIDILLTDWKTPFVIDTRYGKFVDGESDPSVIGYGLKVLTTDYGDYVHFEIPIDYRSDATPSYICIVAASSRFGDAYTGSSDSILYIDELQLNY